MRADNLKTAYKGLFELRTKVDALEYLAEIISEGVVTASQAAVMYSEFGKTFAQQQQDVGEAASAEVARDPGDLAGANQSPADLPGEADQAEASAGTTEAIQPAVELPGEVDQAEASVGLTEGIQPAVELPGEVERAESAGQAEVGSAAGREFDGKAAMAHFRSLGPRQLLRKLEQMVNDGIITVAGANRVYKDAFGWRLKAVKDGPRTVRSSATMLVGLAAAAFAVTLAAMFCIQHLLRG